MTNQKKLRKKKLLEVLLKEDPRNNVRTNIISHS
jgi:hypothetical protein